MTFNLDNIGSSYEDMKKEIKKSISREESKVITEEGLACYFCLKPIDGLIYETTIETKTGEEKYYTHTRCP